MLPTLIPDINLLFNKFLTHQSHRYVKFTQVWRELDFSKIINSCTSFNDYQVLLENIFSICFLYLDPSTNSINVNFTSNDEDNSNNNNNKKIKLVKTAALYLLYASYFLVNKPDRNSTTLTDYVNRINNPIQIRVTIKNYENLNSHIEWLSKDLAFDAVIAFRLLQEYKAFTFCLTANNMMRTKLWNHRLVNKDVRNGLPIIKGRENLKTDNTSSPTENQVTENSRKRGSDEIIGHFDSKKIRQDSGTEFPVRDLIENDDFLVTKKLIEKYDDLLGKSVVGLQNKSCLLPLVSLWKDGAANPAQPLYKMTFDAKDFKLKLTEANENTDRSLKLHIPILQDLKSAFIFTTDNNNNHGNHHQNYENIQPCLLKYLKISPDADELILTLRNISHANLNLSERNLVIFIFLQLVRTITFASKNQLPKNLNSKQICDKILRLGFKFLYYNLIRLTKPLAKENGWLIYHFKLVLSLSIELDLSKNRLMEFFNFDMVRWNFIVTSDHLLNQQTDSENLMEKDVEPSNKRRKMSYIQEAGVDPTISLRDLIIILTMHTENFTLQQAILTSGYSGCQQILLKSDIKKCNASIVNNVCKAIYANKNEDNDDKDYQMLEKLLDLIANSPEKELEAHYLESILNSLTHFSEKSLENNPKTIYFLKKLLNHQKLSYGQISNFGRCYFKIIKSDSNKLLSSNFKTLMKEISILVKLGRVPCYFQKTVLNFLFSNLELDVGDENENGKHHKNKVVTTIENIALCFDLALIILKENSNILPDIHLIFNFWPKLYNRKFVETSGEMDDSKTKLRYNLITKYLAFLNQFDSVNSDKKLLKDCYLTQFSNFIHLEACQQIFAKYAFSLDWFGKKKQNFEKSLLETILNNKRIKKCFVKDDQQMQSSLKKIFMSLNLDGQKNLDLQMFIKNFNFERDQDLLRKMAKQNSLLLEMVSEGECDDRADLLARYRQIGIYLDKNEFSKLIEKSQVTTTITSFEDPNSQITIKKDVDPKLKIPNDITNSFALLIFFCENIDKIGKINGIFDQDNLDSGSKLSSELPKKFLNVVKTKLVFKENLVKILELMGCYCKKIVGYADGYYKYDSKYTIFDQVIILIKRQNFFAQISCSSEFNDQLIIVKMLELEELFLKNKLSIHFATLNSSQNHPNYRGIFSIEQLQALFTGVDTQLNRLIFQKLKNERIYNFSEEYVFAANLKMVHFQQRCDAFVRNFDKTTILETVFKKSDSKNSGAISHFILETFFHYLNNDFISINMPHLFGYDNGGLIYILINGLSDSNKNYRLLAINLISKLYDKMVAPTIKFPDKNLICFLMKNLLFHGKEAILMKNQPLSVCYTSYLVMILDSISLMAVVGDSQRKEYNQSHNHKNLENHLIYQESINFFLSRPELGPDNFPNFLPTWFSKSSEISSKNKRAFILNYLHLIINSITTGHHYRNLARLDIFNILMTSFDSNFFEVEQRMEILGWILAGVKSNSYVRMRLEKDSKILDWLRIVRLRGKTEFKKLIDDSEILK